MERFPKLESLLSRLSLVLIATVSSTQLALADSNAPPGSQILPGVYQGTPVIAQQSGWPNTPPQVQSDPGNTSSLPAPPPQNSSYQPQLILPSNDPNPYGASAPGQAPMQGYTQLQQQQQIQPGQLQGYPVSQQAPGQLPAQGGYGAPPQNYQQQPQYAQQQTPTQYGQAQQSSAPASPPGWQADYPNPNDVNNSTASQVPMDTAQPQKQGLGSKLGKALGGVAKMAGPVAGMGMAGMAAASMGNMMRNSYGMGGMGMGGYGMGGMGMGGYGMGGMGMGGMGMGGMGMGGYGMPMGMGGYGMGMGQNMMMNSVLNQGLRMLQR